MFYLFRSWQDSLALCLPKQFKLFLLVTFKSAVELYGNLLYFFWWLILITFIFWVGVYDPAWAIGGLWWLLIGNILVISLVYVWFMLARPSVLPKDYPYFKQHIKKTALGFLGIYALFDYVRILLIPYPIVMIARSLFTGEFLNPLYPFLVFRLNLIPFVIFPPFVCVVLFYFDSDGGLKAWFLSILRGLVMYIYNLPFCLLSMILFFLLWHIPAFFSVRLAEYMLWLFIPLVLSYFKCMYIKRLHDQFDLYYAQE